MDNKAKVEAVQKMQDFINENITSPITLSMLAKAAGYSPWYSAKIFKELIGKSPFDYIRTIRLSKAALKLRDENVKVVDVAFDFVFDSHEGFTRAFSKEFGINPKNYSKKTPPVKLFMTYPISHYYKTLEKGEDIVEKQNTIFVQVIERPARKLILKRGKTAKNYFEYCEDLDCESAWGILTSIKEALYEPMGMWLPQNMIKEGTSSYAQGVEVPLDYDNEVPEGFDIIELEPCKIMIFQGEPYEDEEFMTAIDQLQEKIKSYDPKIYGFEWANEDAPRFQLEPWGYRGYIEGRPVRTIKK